MNCKSERDDILRNFLNSSDILEMISLSEDELKQVRFGHESSDLLIEAIKKMIFSYCNNESDTQVIRSINSIIQNQITSGPS